jgi:hypothetical protein
MLSTLCTAETTEAPRKRAYTSKMKQNWVIYYNTYFHSIDSVDQYLFYHSVIEMTIKWPRIVSFYLLQSALFQLFHHVLQT